jgi:hypothetical protein
MQGDAIRALREHVGMRTASPVCCDKFLAKTGPDAINPQIDLDCDGDSNASDKTEECTIPRYFSIPSRPMSGR